MKIFALVVGLGIWLTAGAVGAVETVKIQLFYGEGCPHCAKERVYLEELQGRQPDLVVEEYEIYHNQANAELLTQVAAKLSTKAGGVPFLVIGEQVVVGFGEGVTPDEIERKIEVCRQTGCRDVVGEVRAGEAEFQGDEEVVEPGTREVEVPIWGKLAIDKLSLPALTVILAGLDGFNPCAMWTLLFLISLLLPMKDRKRMWILGVAFIGASAGVYFLFLSAWLNLFTFLGWVSWIRGVVGIVALLGGVYYLWDFVNNRSGSCRVMGNEKRQRVFDRLRQLAQKRNLFLAIVGIISLAVAVNLVELVCSAGLPAVYTQVLSMSNLATWQYYLYLGLYILIFMADDMLIFVTAMVTLRAVGVGGKYARISHLVGGILMIVIGLALIWRPELLMWG